MVLGVVVANCSGDHSDACPNKARSIVACERRDQIFLGVEVGAVVNFLDSADHVVDPEAEVLGHGTWKLLWPDLIRVGQ